jgi:hypothetical protein
MDVLAEQAILSWGKKIGIFGVVCHGTLRRPVGHS